MPFRAFQNNCRETRCPCSQGFFPPLQWSPYPGECTYIAELILLIDHKTLCFSPFLDYLGSFVYSRYNIQTSPPPRSLPMVQALIRTTSLCSHSSQLSGVEYSCIFSTYVLTVLTQQAHGIFQSSPGNWLCFLPEPASKHLLGCLWRMELPVAPRERALQG